MPQWSLLATWAPDLVVALGMAVAKAVQAEVQVVLLRRLLVHLAQVVEPLELHLLAPRLLVIGSNGIGKSNLLESVELLGSLRSHRSSQDADLIHWDAPRALLKASCVDDIEVELEGVDFKPKDFRRSVELGIDGAGRCTGDRGAIGSSIGSEGGSIVGVGVLDGGSGG